MNELKKGNKYYFKIMSFGMWKICSFPKYSPSLTLDKF